MNRKAVTALLLLVVAAIWGGVLFKVSGRGEEANVQQTTLAAPVAPAAEAVDTLSASALGNYRDPFLGAMPAKRSTVPVSSTQRPPAKRAFEVAKSWPKVSYRGAMRNHGRERGVALLSIDGKDAMVPLGGEEKGVTVKAIYADSVLLVANGEQRVVRQ